MGKPKNKFKKQFRKEGITREECGENPFEASWRFEANINPLLLFIDGHRVYIPTANKSHIQKILKNEFELYCTDRKYTRLFLADKGFKDIVYSLTGKAREILLWITIHLKYGDDFIFLNRFEIVEKFNIRSPGTIKIAIEELEKANLICKTKVRNYYWINVQYFFEGNRANYFKNSVYEKNINYNEIKKKYAEAFVQSISKRLNKRPFDGDFTEEETDNTKSNSEHREEEDWE